MSDPFRFSAAPVMSRRSFFPKPQGAPRGNYWRVQSLFDLHIQDARGTFARDSYCPSRYLKIGIFEAQHIPGHEAFSLPAGRHHLKFARQQDTDLTTAGEVLAAIIPLRQFREKIALARLRR